MKDDQFRKLLREKDFVVIPSANIMDIYQDGYGLVRISVGIGKDNDGNLLYFMDRDSIMNGGLNNVEEEE